MKPSKEQTQEAVRTLLRYIGEDPEREGLIDTPRRIVDMYAEIFRGYQAEKKPKITTFSNESGCTDIVFDTGTYYSMCEHHMLPFFGRYFFAYVPDADGKILGLSKIARVVGYCAARLQLQERLVHDVIDMLNEALDGKTQGMALMLRGQHLCKSMRGTRTEGEMSAVHLSGVFKKNSEARREFYSLIR